MKTHWPPAIGVGRDVHPQAPVGDRLRASSAHDAGGNSAVDGTIAAPPPAATVWPASTVPNPSAVAARRPSGDGWADQLSTHGFTPTAAAGLWEHGPRVALLRMGRPPQFFYDLIFDRPPAFDPHALIGIAGRGERIELWRKDAGGAVTHERWAPGFSMARGFRDAPPPPALPLAEQLQASAFVDVGGDGRLFTGTLPGAALEPREVTLLIDGDRVARALGHWNEAAQNRVTSSTRLVDYVPYRYDLGAVTRYCDLAVFENRHARFALNAFGKLEALELAPVAGTRDWAELPDDVLGVVPIKARREPNSAFIVGGMNPPEVLTGLTRLNGRPVADLEMRMRPGGGSDAGYLGANESLVGVLVEDTATVARLGLTHAALARALSVVAAIADHAAEEFTDGKAFDAVIGGSTFTLRKKQWLGSVGSPFGDGSHAQYDYTVRRADDGAAFTFSQLLPPMVARYGFYEGKGTRYRVAPETIAHVLAPILRSAHAQHAT